jgi:hypothetical protein
MPRLLVGERVHDRIAELEVLAGVIALQVTDLQAAP